jgi:voltage-gated potassium channel
VTPLRDLAPGQRRRLVLRALLRGSVSAAVIVALYYLLPLDHLSDAGSVLLLTLGLIVVMGMIGWEVRAILKADYPAIQAVGALAMTVPLFLVLFATTFYLIDRATPGSFSQQLDRTGALYFTVTTFSTVGYGDITARTDGARLIVIAQMLADLIVIGFGVKIIFGAVQMGRQRGPEGAAPGQPASSDPVSSD